MGHAKVADMSANRRLTPVELVVANQLLADLRTRLRTAANSDASLLFALRRKIAKELVYDERSKPMERRKLKTQKRGEQHGLCASCQLTLPETYIVLDRFSAEAGYTMENTRVLCESCDRIVQQERRYA